MAVRYRSKETGDVVTYAQAIPRLERDDRYDKVVDPDDAPAKSAPKSDWVDFAVSQGMDRDEAEAATKDDLTGRYLQS